MGAIRVAVLIDSDNIRWQLGPAVLGEPASGPQQGGRAGPVGRWRQVLPLALKSTPSTPLEAASTLLLDRLVRDSFQLRAAILEACQDPAPVQ